MSPGGMESEGKKERNGSNVALYLGRNSDKKLTWKNYICEVYDGACKRLSTRRVRKVEIQKS